MLFKFLEKPIYVTAYLSSDFSFVNTYSPIKASSHFIPTWWKNTPKSEIQGWKNNEFIGSTTTKSCLGIIGTFQNGYVMPLWSDVSIKLEPNRFSYKFSDEMTKLQFHSNQQAPGFHDDYLICKVNSPWLIESSENINFLFCDPIFATGQKNYSAIYGIIPAFNGYLNSNIFLLFKKEPSEIFIKHNTPLLHIIPITEKRIIFKTEVINFEEYTKKASIITRKFSFLSKGLNMLKILRNQKNG